MSEFRERKRQRTCRLCREKATFVVPPFGGNTHGICYLIGGIFMEVVKSVSILCKVTSSDSASACRDTPDAAVSYGLCSTKNERGVISYVMV